jgi:5-dehydro-2-deoxygluconokinase
MSILPPDRFPLTFYRDGCADRELTEKDVDRSPVADAAVVVVTGTGLSHEPGRSATRRAAATGRVAGGRVIVDLDYRPDQWRDRAAYAAEIHSLLADAHLAVGTEEEVSAATNGETDLDAAATRLLARGLEAVVLKKGSAGCRIYEPGGGRIDVAPFPIEVLNVLGAGDAFASGLIYGLRRGWPLPRAARVGNATGAIVVTRHGCANFMPTWPEVDSFVESRGGWQ